MDYCDGVQGFINFATSIPRNFTGGGIRCLCRKCQNKKYLHPDVVMMHLLHKSFMENYHCWYAHGEVIVRKKRMGERVVGSAYKVISKILAGGMANVPAQNAFLGGRNMAANINLMREILRYYCRKRASPRCIIKIDFRKAFDYVQWPFLKQLMNPFPDHFVHLVMMCVETTSFSVAVNGDLFGFFAGKCGVRQGDPLSPYLFIMCMEYFSRLLNLATQKAGFHFHPKCQSLGISHLAFADDILLLCRCDTLSVDILL
jgi:hypothetical protein